MIKAFGEVFEKSPVAMLIVNSAGLVTMVNHHAENLFGYAREELIGRAVEVLVPDQYKTNHLGLLTDYLKSPTPRQMGAGRGLYGQNKTGEHIPIEVGLNPFILNGEMHILCSVLDIRERKMADAQFRSAVEAAPNGMLMIDENRTIVLVNKKIEEIFGYDRTELQGKPIEILVPDDFKSPHPQFVQKYFQKPEARSMGIGRELFGRQKSGKLIPVEIGLNPITVQGKMFVISSVVDISMRRKAEAEIARKTEEIEEFSYRTSHDLRSPLNSIAAMADCGLENLNEQALVDVKENLNYIRKQAHQLLGLIDQILMLAKVEIENTPGAEFDFVEYIESFKARFSELIRVHGVRVEGVFLHNHALKIQKIRLIQILDNLLANGTKYSNQNELDRRVELHTFSDAHRFLIRVSDNGLGIPINRHAEMFGMFKRFHEQSTEGSGLGLYLVKKQVMKINGKIEFESNSKGTIFYIEIPNE